MTLKSPLSISWAVCEASSIILHERKAKKGLLMSYVKTPFATVVFIQLNLCEIPLQLSFY